MILKVRGTDNNIWHLYDNVDKFRFGTNVRSDQLPDDFEQLKRGSEFDNVVEIQRRPVHNNPSWSAAVCFIRNQESYLINFDTQAFVMNDSGETIEKIVPSSEKNTIKAGPNLSDREKYVTERGKQVVGLTSEEKIEKEKSRNNSTFNPLSNIKRQANIAKEDEGAPFHQRSDSSKTKRVGTVEDEMKNMEISPLDTEKIKRAINNKSEEIEN